MIIYWKYYEFLSVSFKNFQGMRGLNSSFPVGFPFCYIWWQTVPFCYGSCKETVFMAVTDPYCMKHLWWH